MRILIGLLLGIALVIVLGVAFIYSGIYNVAALTPHNPVVYWALDTTIQRSVSARAEEIEAPVQFAEDDVRNGAEHFSETCVMCHGAPGVEPSEVGKGLRPDPPELGHAVQNWSTSELFWIVKHGIKMTGMPGFGPTHPDEDLWAVVAFLQRLPELSPEQYQAIIEGSGGGHGSGAQSGGNQHGGGSR